MGAKSKIGQIFLTHQKDKNFTSVYEEALSKQGQTLELFAALDIGDGYLGLNRATRADYDKLAQILVAAFKRSYIQTVQIDQNSFERALATINSALARFAQKGKVGWYNKLNVAVAALYKNVMSVSVAGNAQIFLQRGKELSLLSEGLAENPPRPTKVFSNYSSGRLISRDRVILGTNQLFNYLSLERLREFLAEDTLEETCQEIISALKDIKTMGFATFIFDVTTGQKPAEPGAIQYPAAPTGARSGAGSPAARIAGEILWAILGYLWKVLATTVSALINIIRKRRIGSGRKKILFAIIGLLAIILLGNIAYGLVKKSSLKKQIEAASAISQMEEKLNEAEAALIYNDQNRISALLAEAKKLLSEIKENPAERQILADRLTALTNKVSKQITVDNPTVLTRFPNLPTQLIHSPSGFLGFNRNSGSLAFYDFASGETRAILKNENPGNFVAGAFVGGGDGFVLLTKNGNFSKLNPKDETLTGYDVQSPSLAPGAAGRVGNLSVLGDGASARIYALDKSGQIWRLRVSGFGISQAETWLKAADPKLSESTGMAVDGNIYVQFPDATKRYFNGSQQPFKIPALVPALKQAGQIFTAANYEFLYILDGENKRIVVLNKQGGLQRQIVSEKFRDLADVYVDEPNKIIYALSGSELLQVGF